MAKNKRHIDHELKTKLGAHEVPVMESEWTAFESFRNKRESKRRRFIYLIAAALVFIAVSGMLVWKIQDTNSKFQAPNARIENESRLPEQANGLPGLKESPRRAEGSRIENESRHPEQANGLPGLKESPRRAEGSRIENESRHPEQANDVSDLAESPRRVEGLSPGEIPFFTFHIVPPVLDQAEIPVVVAYEKGKDQDTGMFARNSSRIPPKTTPSLAFGLAYGFGNPSLTVGNNDTTQTHRQYEQTLKGAKQNSQVFRMFLQYEYRLKFGMEFGAGLQFTSQTQLQQYNFEMRDIPYLYPDGSIWFYIPIPDSQPVTPTVFESKQNIYTASLPLSVGYVHKLGTNFRMGMRAQGSLGLNWSKDFNGLSPKTLSETTVSANVNPLNLSYGGGLFGEYFYLRGWSARLSLDWTAQNKQFKASNGYNITNRYYEFKLALVRYL